MECVCKGLVLKLLFILTVPNKMSTVGEVFVFISLTDVDDFKISLESVGLVIENTCIHSDRIINQSNGSI